MNKNAVRIFEEKQVRATWDNENGKWWFSIVDICAILTDSDYQPARKYWKVLKGRLEKEGNQSVTNCYQLKLEAADGKKYLTDVADTEQILRLVQSIPSKKLRPPRYRPAGCARRRSARPRALGRGRYGRGQEERFFPAEAGAGRLLRPAGRFAPG